MYGITYRLIVYRLVVRVKRALYRIWCGVNRLGDSRVKVV